MFAIYVIQEYDRRFCRLTYPHPHLCALLQIGSRFHKDSLEFWKDGFTSRICEILIIGKHTFGFF